VFDEGNGIWCGGRREGMMNEEREYQYDNIYPYAALKCD